MIVFQSQFGPEPWLKPRTATMLEELAAQARAAYRHLGARIRRGLPADPRGVRDTRSLVTEAPVRAVTGPVPATG